LVLVVLLKYSKQDAKTSAVDSLHSGTMPLDLTGSGVASFVHRRTTDADHHTPDQ
jgi:hypothetical protein